MFYDNFLKICMSKGLSPRKVLEEAGLSKNMLDRYKKNSSTPKFENLVLIAEVLEVSPDDLISQSTQRNCNVFSDEENKLIYNFKKLNEVNKMTITLQIQKLIAEQDVIQLPLLGNKVSAGTGFDLYDNGYDLTLVDILNTPQSIKSDFLLQIDGDSMMPEFEDGDIVLVKRTPSILVGQIGIFQCNSAVCKGYIKKLGKNELISLNPDYKNIPLTPDITCIGLVVGKAELI